MTQFGENLKRMRNEKNITQQEVANQMYVTRQTVSRWENGTRYPDLLMAKKLAEYFNVSLDSLLKEDDFHIYPQINPLHEDKKEKNIITILYAFAFMLYFLYHIMNFKEIMFSLNPNLLFKGVTWPMTIISFSWSIGEVMIMILLGYCVYLTYKDKMNAKMAPILSVSYMLIPALSYIIVYFCNHKYISYFLQSILYICLVIVIICYFFHNQYIKSPYFIYMIAIAYITKSLIDLSGWCIRMQNLYTGLSFLGNEIIQLKLVRIIIELVVFSILSYQAYVLYRKRQLVNK